MSGGMVAVFGIAVFFIGFAAGAMFESYLRLRTWSRTWRDREKSE